MSEQKSESTDETPGTDEDGAQAGEKGQQAEEFGGPQGKEPTRYGDWEKNGRCIDF
ncbi:MAG: DUF1674 domain-containing protein [Gammaproteobacteria bacterium]|nr:DUF1674 domain-containing protein [Gammaproteobacteria bacterium]MDH3446822.1 DUF1674 domain-containing protein [Gammaproteobacteria bacterium]